MALQLSDRTSFSERRNQIINALHAMPAQIKKVLKQDKHLKQFATTIADNKSLFFMSRRYQYVLCYRNVIVMLTRPSDMLPISRSTQDQGNQLHAL
jgi:glucosamine--fructose-6-phosphate aminotransferase (isomerizing)